MATSPTYCTARDVKDVFPSMDQYDDKKPIYGWVTTNTTNLYKAGNCGKITNLHVDGINEGAAESDAVSVNSNGKWYYSSTEDACYYYNDTTSPVERLMEAGEDYDTLITRMISNASRYFDSRVDSGIPRDMFKNRQGVYDYMIIRTTALLASYFLSNSKEPGSDFSKVFLEEANFNIEQINSGKSKLSYQVSPDSSSGVIREVVAPQNANPLRIVDTRGMYNGTYDLIKVVISTAGVIGTAKFDVYTGDETGLKKNKVVDGEFITGKYQTVASGLQIRFSGKDDSSTATLGGTPDEWEIEVWGFRESMDGSPGTGRNTQMTRTTIHSYPTKL